MAIHDLTVARPYAKAAFEFAKSANATEAWGMTLARFAMIAQDSNVQGFLQHPAATQAQHVTLFNDLCDNTLDEKHLNFLRVLADVKRLALLPAIADLFQRLRAEDDKTTDIHVRSFEELSDAQKTKLKAKLAQRFGGNVELECTVDKSLLGGVLLSAPALGEVIDGSVRGQLQKLATAITD